MTNTTMAKQSISEKLAAARAKQMPTTPPDDEPKMSYYERAQATEPSGAVILTHFVEAIRSEEFAFSVQALRAHKAAGNEDEYSAAKRSLPAVSISGKTTEGKRAKSYEEGRFEHSGYLQVDLDAKDNVGWTVEEMRDILRAEPRIVASFVTPSGDSVKGIARIRPDIDTHLASFIAVRDHFKKHNLVIDEACKDPGRLCFVSHDPDAWIDLDRTAVFDPAPEVDHTSGVPQESLILRLKASAFPTPPTNGIHTWLMQAAWWCRINGHTEQQTVEKLSAYDGTLRRRFQPNEVTDACSKVYSVPRDPAWRIEQDIAAMINPPAGSTATEFAPQDIYYDQPKGVYYVHVNGSYHLHGKQKPVTTGLARYLSKEISDAKELHAAVKSTIADRELDGGVQWAGSIAGHKQGINYDIDGKPILILAEPTIPQPAPGEFPIITNLLSQAFSDGTAMSVWISWLAGRYRALRHYTHIPAPMLVMAGEVNSGKSLLAWIAAQMLGGRTANPYAAWSGGTLWNDNLIAAETLLIDDCQGNTDIRTRRTFGAAFKESIYPSIVELRKRNVSSLSVRPVWACILCCNDTPEALQIIPPLEADMEDKIILLHVSQIKVPVDTSHPEGRLQLQKMLREEFPAFAQSLAEWETPADLHDSRSGILAWRDPELEASIDANSPVKRLEALLDISLQHLGIWHDLPREFTATEIEMRLTDPQSPVRDQARALFNWHGACGATLSRLVRTGRGPVEFGIYDSHKKSTRYYIPVR